MSAESTIDERTDGNDLSERDSLEARIEELEAANRRLRKKYARTQRVTYRRTALGLIGMGLVAVAGGILFPGTRAVLFALGGTGLFAGFLTYYLTPEQFIAASVGERVYTALADNETSMVADLGLSNRRVYVPAAPGGDTAVRLFVPQQEEYDLPERDDHTSTFVVPEDDRRRGVSLRPTGDPLFTEFERALSGELSDDLSTLLDQLTDALVEQFELVDGIRIDVDSEAGRATVGVSGSSFGSVDRFDHPVCSFVAVGLSRSRDRPIEVAVDTPDDDRVDQLLTYRWSPSE